MIALSFYIGCFRLSSVRESKLVDGAEPCSAQVAQNANAGLAVAASRFAQKGTVGAQQELLDPDSRCAVFAGSKVLQAILRHASYSITKRRINILTAANVMSIC